MFQHPHSHSNCTCHQSLATFRAPVGRRSFLAGAGLAAVAAPFVMSPKRVLAAGVADALLLSCMDYRLIDDLVPFMNGLGLNNKYDHVILAGASLAVVDPALESWQAVFWQHLDIAIDLHGIHQVVVVDHRDCGAYRLVLGEDAVATPEIEIETHRAMLQAFSAEVAERHPDLEIGTYMMELDGSVEAL